MQITYTFCPLCGALADDSCQAHPGVGIVTEAHHADDYATVKQSPGLCRDLSGQHSQIFTNCSAR